MTGYREAIVPTDTGFCQCPWEYNFSISSIAISSETKTPGPARPPGQDTRNATVPFIHHVARQGQSYRETLLRGVAPDPREWGEIGTPATICARVRRSWRAACRCGPCAPPGPSSSPRRSTTRWRSGRLRGTTPAGTKVDVLYIHTV
ncbi:hypothetical protein EVAR_86598_1 [Eumeta japonica]|uniref:Uncharacterized protein n=1 Tax=Eumeta variegata TaxID=151549 RepID=A0A4C1W148_EUMVA|nr:hypothetical protein EVAR_86598_1 [Eumeta japonica]